MKFAALAFLVSLILSPASAHAQSLQPGDTVAICGDSITEQKMYSVYMQTYLLICQPEMKLKTHQFGWSGETVNGFWTRIEDDVLPFQPTVATICYGMNDGGYAPIDPKRQSTYRQWYENSVKRLKEGGVRSIVVGSPGAVDTDTFDLKSGKTIKAADYNVTLADLASIAKEVADKQGVSYVNLNALMLDVMAKAKAEYGPAYHVCGPDGFHPAANGHLIMAYGFLKALGCTGDIGTITVDGRTGVATATEGHRILSATAGTVEIESSRYPFCFPGKPEDPGSTRGIVEFLPFNEDLNRFRLIVKNPSAPRMQITWGKETKTFDAAQLAQGINLAAEFLDSPFRDAFGKVQSLVRKQQEQDTHVMRNLLHTLPPWRKALPNKVAFFDSLPEEVIAPCRALGESARAAVQPVKHTLTISPST